MIQWLRQSLLSPKHVELVSIKIQKHCKKYNRLRGEKPYFVMLDFRRKTGSCHLLKVLSFGNNTYNIKIYNIKIYNINITLHNITYKHHKI